MKLKRYENPKERRSEYNKIEIIPLEESNEFFIPFELI